MGKKTGRDSGSRFKNFLKSSRPLAISDSQLFQGIDGFFNNLLSYGSGGFPFGNSLRSFPYGLRQNSLKHFFGYSFPLAQSLFLTHQCLTGCRV